MYKQSSCDLLTMLKVWMDVVGAGVGVVMGWVAEHSALASSSAGSDLGSR